MSARAHEFVFVVKVSKFCNLRCSYCYEHRELHVRDIMSIETLALLFAGIDAFGDYLRGRGMPASFSFVWHGGEPLLIAAEYYRRIAEMQQESIRRYAYRNSVQTNLYSFNRASLDFVLASDWELGVSIDFAEGVRRNVGGRDSNDKVIANAEGLRVSRGRFGLISVLGKHNRATLVEAYDWAAEFAEGWRILPLFAGGPEEATAELQLSPHEVAEVLVELFRKRANSERHLPIAPLDDYTKASVLRIVDQPGAVDIGRALLENIVVINVNGDVFTRPFAYDPRYCLGNIARHSMQQMLETQPYNSCQQDILRKKQANCMVCDFRGYCDSTPMHEHGSIARDNGLERCGAPRATIAAIHAELIGAGVDAPVVGEWAREWLARRHAAVA